MAAVARTRSEKGGAMKWASKTSGRRVLSGAVPPPREHKEMNTDAGTVTYDDL